MTRAGIARTLAVVTLSAIVWGAAHGCDGHVSVEERPPTRTAPEEVSPTDIPERARVLVSPPPLASDETKRSERRTTADEHSSGRLPVLVLDDGGKPVIGARVYSTSESDPGPIGAAADAVVSDSAGRASIPIDFDAQSFVIATHADFQAASIELVATAEADRPAEIVLTRGLDLHGRVETRTGDPVGGLEIRAFGPRSGGLWRHADRMLYSAKSIPDVHTATSGADGRFTIKGLRDAQYFVTAIGDGLAPIPSVAFGARHERAGGELVLRVAPTFVCAGRFIDTHDRSPVPIADLKLAIVSVDGASGGSLRQGVGGGHWFGAIEELPSVGTFSRAYQADRMADSITFRVSSARFETTTVTMPASAISDPRREALLFELERVAGDWGELALVASSPEVGADLSPYSLLVRSDGATGNTWERVTVTFDAAGEARIPLPCKRLELFGKYLGNSGPKGASSSVSIGRDVTTRLEVGYDQQSVGAVELDVRTSNGVPVYDYRYRLIPTHLWERGSERGAYRGYARASLDPGRRGPPERVPCVAPGDYVASISKDGFDRHVARVTITGGSTKHLVVTLKE